MTRTYDMTFSLQVFKMNLNNLVSFFPSDNNLFCWAFIINVFIYEVLSIHSLSINLAVLSFNRSLACRQNNYTFKSLCHQHFRLMNSKCSTCFIASMCVFILSYFSFISLMLIFILILHVMYVIICCFFFAMGA